MDPEMTHLTRNEELQALFMKILLAQRIAYHHGIVIMRECFPNTILFSQNVLELFQCFWRTSMHISSNILWYTPVQIKNYSNATHHPVWVIFFLQSCLWDTEHKKNLDKSFCSLFAKKLTDLSFISE